MTLITIRYELQGRLTPEQLQALSEFSNTYGLRRVQLDAKNNTLEVDYDASRLKETMVEFALRGAGIPVVRRPQVA